MFDTYTSLGNNCEVAFQIRRILGKDSSGFFSWNVTMLPALKSLLQAKFAGILETGNLTNNPESGLLLDSSHNFQVHSPFTTKDFLSEANAEENLASLRSKFSHFIDKFIETAKSDARVAYFYKTEDSAEVRERAIEIRDCLRTYHNGKQFSLIVLQRDNAREPQWDEDQIFNRYLKRFAPWADATDGHVSSWDKIFREFPHAESMRFAGY